MTKALDAGPSSVWACILLTVAKKRPIERVLLPREGFRDVKTQLGTLVHVGGNTFGQKRKPLHEETR